MLLLDSFIGSFIMYVILEGEEDSVGVGVMNGGQSRV
jgi:hypothetical protein